MDDIARQHHAAIASSRDRNLNSHVYIRIHTYICIYIHIYIYMCANMDTAAEAHVTHSTLEDDHGTVAAAFRVTCRNESHVICVVCSKMIDNTRRFRVKIESGKTIKADSLDSKLLMSFLDRPTPEVEIFKYKGKCNSLGGAARCAYHDERIVQRSAAKSIAVVKQMLDEQNTKITMLLEHVMRRNAGVVMKRNHKPTKHDTPAESISPTSAPGSN